MRIRISIVANLVAEREAGNTVEEPNTSLTIEDEVTLLMSNGVSISILLVIGWLSSITLLS